MPEDIERRLALIEAKIDKTYESAEKTRKYFLWMLIAGVAGFVLPLVGLLFAIPSFLSTYGDINSLIQ